LENEAEIFDSQGQLVDTLPPNSRRGISRVEWSMRTQKRAHVPPAATAAFEAAQDLEFCRTYTVKMTRGKETYSTQLAGGSILAQTYAGGPQTGI